MKKTTEDNDFSELRKTVEQTIRGTRTLRDDVPQDVKILIQELQRRQVELEIQNEELRRAKQELEESQACGNRKIAEILASIQDGFFTLDRDWRFAYVNRRAAANLGLKPEDLLGKNLWERFPRILGTPHEASYRKAMETRETQQFEMHGVLTEGWYSITAYPCEEGISIYWQNITERKQVEASLREAERQYRELIRYAPAGIYEIDFRTRRFISVNDAMCRLGGYSRDEMLAMDPFDILDEEGRACFQARIAKWLKGEEPDKNVEYKVRTKDGRILDVVLNATFTVDENGKPLGAAIVGHDVTERRRAEEALRELNATLESKVAERTAELEHRARQLQKLTLELSRTEDRERRRMADILHDDLQQQLAAMKFHLSLLSRRAKDDPQQQSIIERLDQMLSDAVDKSRSLSHELGPAILHQDNLGQTFRWLAGQMQKRHGLIVRVYARGEITLQSDAVKAILYKAGQELLFNVIKHARADEAVVRLRRFKRYVCLSVTDHGRGFDSRALKETTGFGLLSVRERVELLGGHMKIRSAKGKGSTLLVTVPESEEQRTEDRGQRTEDARDSSSIL